MEIISTKNAPQAIGPYVQGMIFENLIFTSGQIGLNPQGELQVGIEAQTRQVLENLNGILKEAGSDFANVLKTTIFLSDMNDFAMINKIYAEFFKEHKPARSTVTVKSLPKGALIEIECIAIINKK